jgi:hypothetical protein
MFALFNESLLLGLKLLLPHFGAIEFFAKSSDLTCRETWAHARKRFGRLIVLARRRSGELPLQVLLHRRDAVFDLLQANLLSLSLGFNDFAEEGIVNGVDDGASARGSSPASFGSQLEPSENSICRSSSRNARIDLPEHRSRDFRTCSAVNAKCERTPACVFR